MDGILLIDKPAGWTSHDVVAKMRRVLGVKKIGHAGTLDPMATGVLVLCVGSATKRSAELMGHDKQYRAVLKLGVTTDTQDITGRVLTTPTALRSPLQGRGIIEETVGEFVGEIMQITPMFSAIKKNGKKLYELARKGKEIEREARPVTIYNIEILNVRSSLVETNSTSLICQEKSCQTRSFHCSSSSPQNHSFAETPVISSEIRSQVPTDFSGNTLASLGDCFIGGECAPLDLVEFMVDCSKGTYIRTLCHDIGQRLGCGGCLAELQRTKSGEFRLEDCYCIEQVENGEFQLLEPPRLQEATPPREGIE